MQVTPSDAAVRVTVRYAPWGVILDGVLIGIGVPMLAISLVRHEPDFRATAFGYATVFACAFGSAIALLAPITIDRGGIDFFHFLPSKRSISWSGMEEITLRRVMFSRWLVLRSPRREMWLPIRSVRSPKFRQAVAHFAPENHGLRALVRGMLPEP